MNPRILLLDVDRDRLSGTGDLESAGALRADSGLFRVISPPGDTVPAGLKQSLNIPFGPACT